MQYFVHSDSKNNKFGELSNEVIKLKTTPKGVSSMCEMVESMVKELIIEREKESQVKIALNLLEEEDSLEKIARVTGLTLEEVKALADEKE